ncbi:hypothetical protein [Bradyrhizobium sp. 143]|uniref:hypothetical protein n=1 Tax=Bradyrhizobium sp. 143 TaxID=2782619 RepID=UPI001FFAD97C|nr:hypothetical protein [Bradyrhizobium sp. 143]MCK1713121.1 hypothetical protein [Bradyrhizobium sp. 143]
MSKAPKGWENAGPSRRRPVRTGKRSSPPGKRRLLVTEVTHDPIKEIIEGWPLDSELGWPALMEVIGLRYGGTWTRQAVAKHDDLQAAFTKRQAKITAFRREKAKSKNKRVARTRDEEVAYLKKQLGLVMQENEDLKKQLKTAGRRMNLWRHNAFLHRMTPQQLDAPMQENDRGRSE